MAYYKFTDGDILANALKTHPSYNFHIYGGNVYINSEPHFSGAFTSSIPGVPPGNISLYEYNVDRRVTDIQMTGTNVYNLTIPPLEPYVWDGAVPASNAVTDDRPLDTSVIYPFLTKDSTQGAFATVSTSDFSQFDMGSLMTADYRLSASISKAFFQSTTPANKDQYANYINSLKNTLNYYVKWSPHYAFSSSMGDDKDVGGLHWDKAQQEVGLISIPSIFYGSSIKKGSVKLQYFISGTLAGELRDVGKNGELIQVTGSNQELSDTDAGRLAMGSGSVAGVVLYNEGFVFLTGSWNLDDNHQEYYLDSVTLRNPQWKYFASTIQSSSIYSDGDGGSTPTILTPSSSYYMEFEGTTVVPNLTMFATAPRNELNHSNNVTYKDVTSSTTPLINGYQYAEPSSVPIKNIVSSSFKDYDESFEKITFISRIAIYDEFKNVLGFAKLATPVKKTHKREFTFKLKLDI